MPFENYMIFEFEKMKGKNYIEIGEKKELKNIFDDPHIESQKKFIFQLFQGQGFNENSIQYNNLLFDPNQLGYTKNSLLVLEKNLQGLMNDVETQIIIKLKNSSLPQKDKEGLIKIVSKDLDLAEIKYFGSINSHVTKAQVLFTHDFNHVINIDKTFSRCKSSCFKSRQKLVNFADNIELSRSQFESFGIKLPETIQDFATINKGPKILTRKMLTEKPYLKRSICYLNDSQIREVLFEIKNCNCTKIFFKDLKKSLTHKYVTQQLGYKKTDFKHINLFSPDPVNVLHVGYDDVKNSWKQVSYNKENQQQLNDNGFFYKNVSSKNDIIYVNRKNLIIKYQQQKAQELKKRDKIKVLPYLSRKLVSQTKTSDLNLKIIPGPHPPFTFGELALIAGINVLYYFNKFLKKLGFKGFFFN